MGREIRPSFDLRVHMPVADVQAAMRRRLKSADCPISGLVAHGRLELHVHGDQQQLWSPQLIADLDPDAAPQATVLRARFGPHPSVWTMYVAGYAASVFFGLVGTSFGVAQLVMEQPPWALLAAPLTLVLCGLLYAVALFGQGLSQGEMTRLRSFLEEALVPDPVANSRPPTHHTDSATSGTHQAETAISGL